MDESEEGDLEKEADNCHNNLTTKYYKCGTFPLVFVIKLGGRMTEIFSVGLQ